MPVKLLVCAVMIGANMAMAQTTQPASQPTTRPASVDAIAWLVGGEWHADGTWANNRPFKARAKYEPALGGKFIECRSFTIEADGTEKPRDLTIFGTLDGKLTAWTFNADGATRTAVAAEAEAGTLVFEWTRMTAEGTPNPLKLTIEKVGEDELLWRVNSLREGDWHTVIEVTWKRVKGK